MLRLLPRLISLIARFCVEPALQVVQQNPLIDVSLDLLESTSQTEGAISTWSMGQLELELEHKEQCISAEVADSTRQHCCSGLCQAILQLPESAKHSPRGRGLEAGLQQVEQILGGFDEAVHQC